MIDVVSAVLHGISLALALLTGGAIIALGVFLCVNAFLLRRSNKTPFIPHLVISLITLVLGVLAVFSVFAKIAESACG